MIENIIFLIIGGIIGWVTSYYFYKKSSEESKKANDINIAKFDEMKYLSALQLEFIKRIMDNKAKWNLEELSDNSWKVSVSKPLVSKITIRNNPKNS